MKVQAKLADMERKYSHELAVCQTNLSGAEARVLELEALQAKNEGRIKHIVDEQLQQRITELEQGLKVATDSG